MDIISYSHANKQAKRIKKVINDPDSNSGIVTVPKVIASGDSVTVPVGRVAVLPNVQVDGTLNIDGEVFVPSGSTLTSNITPSIVVDTIADLKNTSVDSAEVLGYYVKGDGGGGQFYWDNTSTEADNGGTIIQATGITIGRWKRVVNETLNAMAYGGLANVPAGSSVFIGTGVHTVNNVTLGITGDYDSLINVTGEGSNTILKPSTNNGYVLKLYGASNFYYPQYLDNFQLDGSSVASSTGITVDTTGYVAGLRMENITINSFTKTCLGLEHCQFGKFENITTRGLNNSTSVGIKLKAESSGGGANSNDFYGLVSAYNAVGVWIDGSTINPATSKPWGAIANNFYNAQVNSNTVGWYLLDATVNIYGGSPEGNAQASAPATVTIDGKTIPKSSLYAERSIINYKDTRFEEYGIINAEMQINDHTVLNLENASGGAGVGQAGSSLILVKADDTSIINLKGDSSFTGVINKIGSWGDSFTVNKRHASTSIYTQLSGTPNFSYFTSNALPLLSEKQPIFGGSGSIVQTYNSKTDIGYCTTLTYPYSTAAAVINIPNLLTDSVIVISFIVKSSVDRALTALFYDGTNTRQAGLDNGIVLKANKPQRVVLLKSGYSAGSGTLYLYNLDGIGSDLSITNMIVHQGSIGDTIFSQELNEIVCNGAFENKTYFATNSELNSVTSSINTSGKYATKRVLNLSTLTEVIATGRNANSSWMNAIGSTTHTPV